MVIETFGPITVEIGNENMQNQNTDNEKEITQKCLVTCFLCDCIVPLDQMLYRADVYLCKACNDECDHIGLWD